MTKHDQDTWIQKFHKSLMKQDLADNTIRGYLHDLKLFKNWLDDFYQEEIELIHTTTNDIRAFREYLSKIKRHKASSLNRRLQSVKRFYKWAAINSKSIAESPADGMKPGSERRIIIRNQNSLERPYFMRLTEEWSLF